MPSPETAAAIAAARRSADECHTERASAQISFIEVDAEDDGPTVPVGESPIRRRSRLESGDSPSSRMSFGYATQEESLRLGVEEMEQQEMALRTEIRDVEVEWMHRLRPLNTEIGRLEIDRDRMAHVLMQLRRGTDAPPAGPQCLMFVESGWFYGISSMIIAMNLIVMFLELHEPEEASQYWLLDQIFLVFYTAELLLKGTLHQKRLLIGQLSTVWWYWMDLVIVVTGVADQWIAPLLESENGADSDDPPFVNPSALRALRLLRLCRLVRVLKIVRVFIESDLSWTETAMFQGFIMLVIAINTVTIGMELDIDWAGWSYFENVLLIIYLFELSVRIKRWGFEFFYHEDDMNWNLLDFVIVTGAILQQWLVPAKEMLETLITGEAPPAQDTRGGIFKLLRMLRLLRIVRIVRLLRQIKPLYKVLMGITEALSGMQWVLFMTFIFIYAAAILFTALVGHGLIYGEPEEVPKEAHHIFGSVLGSMFMLFKLMSDDQSVVGNLITSRIVQVMFAVFMVISNWAILAILTSVVSDNMISASHRIEKEDDEREKIEKRETSLTRLKVLFEEVDKDRSGSLDEQEFKDVLTDRGLGYELCQASGLKPGDLNDLFLCLCDGEAGNRTVAYKTFIDKLQDESAAVSCLSMFRLEKLIKASERKIIGSANLAQDLIDLSSEKVH